MYECVCPQALKSGAGKGSLRWSVGGAWLNDMKFLAESGISMYASGAHDVSSLTVPGRVFFIKARKLKKVRIFVLLLLSSLIISLIYHYHH